VTTSSGTFIGILYGVRPREGDDGMVDGVGYLDVREDTPTGSSIVHHNLTPDQVVFVDHDNYDDDA
jgi:hypothetical protein